MLYKSWRLVILVVLFIMSQGMTDALAAGTDDARHFADNVGSHVLAIVNAAGVSEEQKEGQLRQYFSENVDIDWMGQFVLGRALRQATPDQRSRYMQAYRQYLLARYTTNLRDYSGSKYTITSVTDEGNSEYSVHMKINSPNAPDRQATDAGYRLQANQNGQFKIRDIIIEGVSLITTQRSDFTSVVNKGGMDMLITDLENKNKNQAAQPQQPKS